jgi:putative phosphoesterase
VRCGIRRADGQDRRIAPDVPSMPKRSFRVGLISDTHGLLRPQALAALHGSDHIVHAGDIGDFEILERLRQLAPVTAVRGNNDTAADFARLDESARLLIGGRRILVLHDIAGLAALSPPGADADLAADVVISGHSHRPGIARRGGVLYVNPGSAGPRRFKLPVGLARLTVADGRVDAELLPLAL